jgi:hypothetical protein
VLYVEKILCHPCTVPPWSASADDPGEIRARRSHRVGFAVVRGPAFSHVYGITLCPSCPPRFLEHRISNTRVLTLDRVASTRSYGTSNKPRARVGTSPGPDSSSMVWSYADRCTGPRPPHSEHDEEVWLGTASRAPSKGASCALDDTRLA